MGESSLPARVVLVGPSGSGKSELAGRIAQALGYQAIDTDAMIEVRSGIPVFEFFGRLGEAAFRAIESEVLADACARSNVVIATGGGIVLKPENWTVFRPGSTVIALNATPETLIGRIQHQLGEGLASAVRPLLAGDPVERIQAQLAARGPLYAQADLLVETDGRSPDDVQERVIDFLSGRQNRALYPAYSLPTQVDRSDIYIRTGIVNQAAALARKRWPQARRAWIITDENVGPRWGETVQTTFKGGGFEVRQIVVPAGEGSKSFEMVARLCNEMNDNGVRRQDVVVAVGGGMVGDLAGFVASIVLRGLSLIQIPTSLLSMVDSSVGGKTGVNTPAGKNLVGAFYQPGLVLIDPDMLATLPIEEYRSGMGEVIKHSIIQPSTPLGGTSLAALLDGVESLTPMPADRIVDALALNVGIKHSVVRADERESGLRMILNFGHTAGHAIEADGYRYRHGEAVALGMLVAGRMALHLERVNPAWLSRLERMIAAAGLPTRYDGDAEAVIERMSRDKKNVNDSLHWILPKPEGGVEIVTAVDLHLVRLALRDLGAG